MNFLISNYKQIFMEFRQRSGHMSHTTVVTDVGTTSKSVVVIGQDMMYSSKTSLIYSAPS